jgi:hypothetical protein
MWNASDLAEAEKTDAHQVAHKEEVSESALENDKNDLVAATSMFAQCMRDYKY